MGKWKAPFNGVFGSNVAKRKRKYNFPPILDLEFFHLSGEVTIYLSNFTFKEIVEDLVSSFTICYESISSLLSLRCVMSRIGYTLNLLWMVKTLFLCTSFSLKSSTLSFSFLVLSVGCCRLWMWRQLYPDRWVFLRALQTLCQYLQISPTINKFMYFYYSKNDSEFDWVSLNGADHGLPFCIYNSSFKNFKSKFFKLKCSPEDLSKRLFFHPDQTPRFSLY